ncbi:hypothetical protein HanPI659440_Chr04g0167541 [Helianthus annuus]|nr:hypothetical protein HanOQP8_Chr04g0154201 [Helianthus annuus]KAJ0796884.1 hypothetical protein HanPI659440_Chr04g0167541 [Helianthus annuus]
MADERVAFLLILIWNAVLLFIYWEMHKNHVEGSRSDLLAYFSSIYWLTENAILFWGFGLASAFGAIFFLAAKTLPEEYFRKIAKTIILATGITIVGLAMLTRGKLYGGINYNERNEMETLP